MDKLKILKIELEEMVARDIDYNEIVKKSKELDHYITKEMIKINKVEIKV